MLVALGARECLLDFGNFIQELLRRRGIVIEGTCTGHVEEVDEVDRVCHCNCVAVEHHLIVAVLTQSAQRSGLISLDVHLDPDVFELLNDNLCAVDVGASDASVCGELRYADVSEELLRLF